MTDTLIEIQNFQRKIFENKTISERFVIGAETIDFGKILVENNIKNSMPEISETELKIAVFRRYYGNFFTEIETNNIIESLILFQNSRLDNKKFNF
jgi:hypothetical protein